LKGSNQTAIFIDTPGLDDTGGAEVDEANFAKLF